MLHDPNDFGGGAVQLEAADLITLNGSIYCDGAHSAAGGSALIISHSLAGSGLIRANGRGGTTCSSSPYPHGEGGIIAVHAVEWGESRLVTTAVHGNFVTLVEHLVALNRR